MSFVSTSCLKDALLRALLNVAALSVRERHVVLHDLALAVLDQLESEDESSNAHVVINLLQDLATRLQEE